MTRSERSWALPAATAARSLCLWIITLWCCGGTAASSLPSGDSFAAGSDWPAYNGSPGGTHYSRLAQINTANVARLELAWTYDTGDSVHGRPAPFDMEVNPLIIKGKLYFVSPKGRLICLDGASGRQQWSFDPAGGQPVYTLQRLRGVSYWSDGRADSRILFTFRTSLYAINAQTGRLIPSFGKEGRIDLATGIDRDPGTISVTNVSPGVIYKDLIILGSTGWTPGDIRAFDVRSGELIWVFHTIPHPGERGYRTWPKDAWKSLMGANCWAGMTLDPNRGWVFVPLASGGMAQQDFYGADRVGDNLYADALVALDARTGRPVWKFQTVRHDLWDRDLPAPPTLVRVERGGKRIDAVAQITKSGFVFVLDRDTGEPLFPVTERPVPASDIPGERTVSHQIFPEAPAPFARQKLTAGMLTHRTPQAHAEALREFQRLRSRGPFDPPSLQGTIILPGLDGGGEWGGAAYDPTTDLLYVNANEMAWTLRLSRRPSTKSPNSGRALYLAHCAACHRQNLVGSPPEIPSLVDIAQRMPFMDMYLQIMGGGGRMPAFGSELSQKQLQVLIEYLRTGTNRTAGGSGATAVRRQSPAYVFDGYQKFLDPDGYPAIAPPWGTLSAINLNTGRYAWRIPFGSYPELAKKGMTHTGSENYGGSIVTAGGVLFIGATSFDRTFHAYDAKSGRLLWEAQLPAGGNATPATYVANGRQFVVISAGGGKDPRTEPEGKLVAFTLGR